MYLLKAIIPVQDLIEKSRKLSDLYISSSILPITIREALKKLREKYEDIVFLVPSEDLINRGSDSITNVIYLIIKTNDPKEVGHSLTDFIKNELTNILLKPLMDEKQLKNDLEPYEDLAKYQISNAIKLVWAVVEVKDENNIYQTKEKLDKIVAYLKSSYMPDNNHIESYKLISKDNNLFYEDNFIDFIKNQENINFEHMQGAVLCSVCGQRTIIGATKGDWRGTNFWQNIHEKENYIAKSGEKLCSFCLAKRILGHKSTEKKDYSFESVSYYALKDYKYFKDIEKALDGLDIQYAYKEEWTDKDLDEKFKLERKPKLEEIYNKEKDCKEPPKYYAILQADGDSMGEKVNKAFKNIESIQAFTKKLADGADIFRQSIKGINGQVIYTGGDDVLAILPKSKALQGYKIISEKFSKLGIGKENELTMSAGIVIAHYKIPLNYVIQKLRENESKAKSMGKNGVYISYIKHSLSSAGAFVKRDHTEYFENLIDIMKEDSFPNTLIAQLDGLLKIYYDETDKIDEAKALIDYILNKKKFNSKDKFTDIIKGDMFVKDGKFMVKNLTDTLKVAKFMAGDNKCI